MKKSFSKHLVAFALLVLINVMTYGVAHADLLSTVQDGGLGKIGATAYGQTTPTDLRILVAGLVKKSLGFLGLIMVVIFVYAGYLWMTAGGDKGQIDKAKSWIRNAVIGLLIIVSSWILTDYIMGCVIRVTMDQGGSLWGGYCNGN